MRSLTFCEASSPNPQPCENVWTANIYTLSVPLGKRKEFTIEGNSLNRRNYVSMAHFSGDHGFSQKIRGVKLFSKNIKE